MYRSAPTKRSDDNDKGLMTEIKKLISPPIFGKKEVSTPSLDVKSTSIQSKVEAHKRCDSCEEIANDLLCCDVCNASFHLQCHDPPFSEETAPQGYWLCKRCKFNSKQPSRDVKESVVKISDGVLVSFDKEFVYFQDEHEESAVFNFQRSGTTGKLYIDKSKNYVQGNLQVLNAVKTLEDTQMREMNYEDVSFKAFNDFVDICINDNPIEFRLPKYISPKYCFPGSNKKSSEFLSTYAYFSKHGSNNNNNAISNYNVNKRSIFHEIDPCTNLVPLPIRFCFICSKSCRLNPLLKCDYCSLFFHLDCLDPPMTCAPTVRWMCPNHPHHLLEMHSQNHMKTISQREKLWDFLSEPIYADVVKLKFLKKVKSKKALHFSKRRLVKRKRFRVPDAIKNMYSQPNLQSSFLKSQFLASSNQNDLNETRFDTKVISKLVALKDESLPIGYLTLITNTDTSFPLFAKSNKIGSAPASDVCLKDFNCNTLSSHHATIYKDELTLSFEFLNYSPFGSFCDEILYGTNNKNLRSDIYHPETKSTNSTFVCICSNPDLEQDNEVNGKDKNGLQGSASLQHASIITIGCLTFVLTII